MGVLFSSHLFDELKKTIIKNLKRIFKSLLSQCQHHMLDVKDAIWSLTDNLTQLTGETLHFVN